MKTGKRIKASDIALLIGVFQQFHPKESFSIFFIDKILKVNIRIFGMKMIIYYLTLSCMNSMTSDGALELFRELCNKNSPF